MKNPFKNPLKIVMPEYKLDTFESAMKESLKKPYIEYTQGGSSRKDNGAVVAGVDAGVKQIRGDSPAGGVASGRATGLGGLSGSQKADR
jgi:hypothetical protein